MVPYHLIQKKRDGAPLETDEVRAFFRAFHSGTLPDYQMAAFLMAVYWRGMSSAELAALVDTIMESGSVVEFPEDGVLRVDKHSTGGVGDKVSLVLAPLVASLGVQVPMMSGRGLGHTTGTVDKLESIPGFRTDLSLEAFQAQVQRIGCALIGQTNRIAPLDGRLYALRDVTATIESVPLIASSIMSKKLAEGIDGLVLDVKRGGGAFLQDLDSALSLAKTMIDIGTARGRRVVVLVSAMDRPLGRAVGNAVEMAEAIETLQGGGPEDLRELTLGLAAEMLLLGGVADDRAQARRAASSALADGRALDRMRLIIEAQDGDAAVLDNPGLLPQAAVRRVVEAASGGTVRGIDARALGEGVVALGGGRVRLDSELDLAVGFRLAVAPGDRVERGQPLGEVLARSETGAEEGARVLAGAVRVGSAGPESGEALLPLVSHRVTADGAEPLSGAG
jgi:pyrimidine-nucleoside phosphorylase